MLILKELNGNSIILIYVLEFYMCDGLASRIRKIRMSVARKKYDNYSSDELQAMADELRKELDESSRLIRSNLNQK